jgi:hypothetical protein
VILPPLVFPGYNIGLNLQRSCDSDQRRRNRRRDGLGPGKRRLQPEAGTGTGNGDQLEIFEVSAAALQPGRTNNKKRKFAVKT